MFIQDQQRIVIKVCNDVSPLANPLQQGEKNYFKERKGSQRAENKEPTGGTKTLKYIDFHGLIQVSLIGYTLVKTEEEIFPFSMLGPAVLLVSQIYFN